MRGAGFNVGQEPAEQECAQHIDGQRRHSGRPQSPLVCLGEGQVRGLAQAGSDRAAQGDCGELEAGARSIERVILVGFDWGALAHARESMDSVSRAHELVPPGPVFLPLRVQ